MSGISLTAQQRASFDRDGFLQIPRLFDEPAMDALLKLAESDPNLGKPVGMRDAQGNISRVSIRAGLDDSAYSAFSRCDRIVDAMEQLLGGEVYHIHHKLML